MLQVAGAGAEVAAKIHHLVDLHRAGKALDRDLALVAAHDHVLDQRVGLVGNQDFAGFGRAFQAAGEVHFATDDGVVHAGIGAEVTHRAVAGVQAHADFQRLGDALGAPLLTQHLHVLAHGDGHGHGSHGVFFRALAGRVAEEHHHAVADELVDGAAVLQGDLRHFVEVGVEQVGEGFGFQLFGQLGKALDVGEEHRELLALGFQAYVLLAAEDHFPDLR